MMRLLVLGDLNLDVHVDEAQVGDGEEARAAVRVAAGGSAGTFARVASTLGARVAFIGAVGNDLVGGLLERSLRDAGVHPHLVRVGRPSGAVVALRRGSERSMICARGANDALDAADLSPEWFAGVSLLHVSGYAFLSAAQAGAARQAIGFARSAGALVSIDPPPANLLRAFGIAQMQREAEAADVIFPNESEARLLAGAATAEEAVRTLALRHSAGAITCGALGAFTWSGAERYRAHVRREIDVDSTGAGDAFAAGFVVAMLEGRPLCEVAERATAAAEAHLAARLDSDDRPLYREGDARRSTEVSAE